MIHYLTEQQFDQLWPTHDQNPLFDSYKGREIYWNSILTPKFNLIYKEATFRSDPSYFGSVEGDQKYINFFLLSL